MFCTTVSSSCPCITSSRRPSGGDVDVVFLHCDAAVDAEEIGEELVVIARDVDDFRPLAALAENLLDHVAVLLRPIDAAAQFPAVDQIAHDIEGLELVIPEKVEKCAGVAALACRDARRKSSQCGIVGSRGITEHRKRVRLSKMRECMGDILHGCNKASQALPGRLGRYGFQLAIYF